MKDPTITIVFYYKGAEVFRDRTLIPFNKAGKDFIAGAISKQDRNKINLPGNWDRAVMQPSSMDHHQVPVPYTTIFVLVAAVTAALLWSTQ